MGLPGPGGPTRSRGAYIYLGQGGLYSTWARGSTWTRGAYLCQGGLPGSGGPTCARGSTQAKPNPLSVAPGLAQRTIFCGGFSFTYFTGLSSITKLKTCENLVHSDSTVSWV